MKKSIVMLIVPAFALGGCAKSNEQIGVPVDEQSVVSNSGSHSQSALYDTYTAATSNGYNGSFEDWQALVKLHETNPEQAAEAAQSSGFSGSSAVMGAIAGAGATALAMQAMNNRNNSSGSGITSTSSRSSYTSSARPSTTTVSRGGFGGAVSSGG